MAKFCSEPTVGSLTRSRHREHAQWTYVARTAILLEEVIGPQKQNIVKCYLKAGKRSNGKLLLMWIQTY